MNTIHRLGPIALLSITTGLLAATVSSQSVIPPTAANQLGGTGLSFPFSYTSYVRFQQAIDQTYAPIGVIHGISFRSRTVVQAVKERQWQEMRVILADLTAANVSGMGGNFDANLATNKLEVFNGRFNIYRPNPADPLEFSVTIPFEKPFLYTASAPLVVDLMPSGQGYEQWPGCGSGGNGTAMDASRDSGLATVLAKGTCQTPPAQGPVSTGGFVIKLIYTPMLMPFGKGCKGSNNKIPQIGSTGTATLGNAFIFTMDDAPANSTSTVFVAGLSNTLSGSLRLPFDLSLATTATGCWQNTEALIVAFLPVSGGSALLPTAIPNSPNVQGVEIFSQFAVDDPGLGGFTVTQGGVIRPL